MTVNTTNQNLEKRKRSRLRQRRAVADIISTMMLMGVTVTGASTLTYFMNDAFISGNLGTTSTLDSSSLNLLLIAYDARDSSTLLSISNVNNNHDVLNPFLCGASCSVPITKHMIPINGGSEFIAFQIQNNGLDSIFLEDVVINGVVHSWDSFTANTQLDASVDDLILAPGRSYPADGLFSISPFDATPIIQNDSIQIQSGKTVNVLVKLRSDDLDLQLNKGIRVQLNVGKAHMVNFLLESGGAQ